jgi:copper chaperone CopZ
MTGRLNFQVIGEQTIHCAGCEQRIGRAIRLLPGVQDVQASAQSQQVRVAIDPTRVRPEAVQAKLEQLGYQVTPQDGGPA